MTTARNDKSKMETVIRRYYDELFNQGRVEIVAELLAEDYVNYSPGSPTMSRGRDGVTGVVRTMRQAFPDLKYRIEDLVVSDDAVAARTTLTGTHRGDFYGLPPTGRSFEVEQMTIEHFANGKIVAHHRVTDLQALLTQLAVGAR
jgi:steroid delta-isomerase-like uncharacterized protein